MPYRVLWILLCFMVVGQPFLAAQDDDTAALDATVDYLTAKNSGPHLDTWFDDNYSGYANPAAYTGFLKAVQDFQPLEVKAKI